MTEKKLKADEFLGVKNREDNGCMVMNVTYENILRKRIQNLMCITVHL